MYFNVRYALILSKNKTGENIMYNEDRVLCGANSYEKKYYLNPKFNNLPEQVKQELQIMCVMFTEEVGGTLIVEYDEDGYLQLITQADEGDLLYDEIGSGLKIHQRKESF